MAVNNFIRPELNYWKAQLCVHLDTFKKQAYSGPFLRIVFYIVKRLVCTFGLVREFCAHDIARILMTASCFPPPLAKTYTAQPLTTTTTSTSTTTHVTPLLACKQHLYTLLFMSSRNLAMP